MYAEIVAAIQSTRTLAELLKAAHSLSNHSELLTAVHAVQMQLTDAISSALNSQEKEAALAEKVRELEKKILDMKNWETETKRYALFEFLSGSLAYALKPGQEQGEPMHYLCTSCMDKKQRSTLQPQAHYLYCPACKTNVSTEKIPSSRPRSDGGSWMSI